MQVAALFTAILLFATTVAAQPTKEQVSAWLVQEYKQAQSLPDLGDFSIAWVRREHNTLSEMEIQALRVEVAKKPDHPRLQELEVAEQRLLKGPSVVKVQLFCDGKAWRFNTDWVETGYYTDRTHTPKHAWQLGPGTLKINSPDSKDPQHDIANGIRILRPALNLLLYGGIPGDAFEDMGFYDVTVSGAKWSATLSRPLETEPGRQYTMKLEGRWSNEHGRGFVDRVVVPPFGGSTSNGGVQVIMNWRFDESVGRWVAGRAEVFSTSGSLTTDYEYTGATPLPTGGLQAVTQTPSRTSTDLVRGRLDLRNVSDFRSGQVTEVDPAGAATVSAIPGVAAESTDWLVVVGWAMAGSTALVLVGVLVRRRFSAQRKEHR